MITKTSTPKSCKLIWTMWSREPVPTETTSQAPVLGVGGHRRPQALSRRVHYGKFVAEAKAQKDEGAFPSWLPPVMSRASLSTGKRCAVEDMW